MENGSTESVNVSTATFTREQWDEVGYNEAISAVQEPFTAYTTQWGKDDDLIYREQVLTATLDESARDSAKAAEVRDERDRRLSLCDWTQLKDNNLDDTAVVLWQSYRQALRDVPQQVGFPIEVEWPVQPEME
ncbi:hypothetical protein HFN16_07025 [Pseudodesulfovibrio sp. zrk46]|nr:hypothetical protein HFN16_07025 [Pseudodesulfovibrio sp. zrk46]